MRTRLVFLAALIGSALALVAQDVAPASDLRVGSRVALLLGRFIDLVGAPKCDGSGNIYARPARKASDNSADEYLLAPIKQVTPEGKMGRTFRLTDAWQDFAGRGMFVDRSGTVYEAAVAPGGVHVVEFAKDGSVKSKTKLETGKDVDPLHLAVFESGRFLVSGESGKNLHTPYTALFEANGKLVKQIYEPEDEDARSKAELGDTEFAHYNDGRGNNFVEVGDVTVGSDGNVYLLHGTSALVYVISSAGDVVRKMRIGVADSGFTLRGIKSYQGRLAIGFAKFGHIEVRLTNLEGVPIGNYGLDSDKSEVPSLACYDSRGFTFVTSASSGSAYLFSAVPGAGSPPNASIVPK